MNLINLTIFTAPLFAWLGILGFILISFQILLGMRAIKLPFWVHMRVIPPIIFTVIVIHAILAIIFYFGL